MTEAIELIALVGFIACVIFVSEVAFNILLKIPFIKRVFDNVDEKVLCIRSEEKEGKQ